MAKTRIDFEDLTVGEIEDLEDLLGVPLTQLKNAKGTTSALIYIFMRRDNPEYTIEDAKKERLSNFDFAGVDVNPTEPVGGDG
jgi:hypothetical protein